MKAAALAALMGALLCFGASARPIQGQATVIDGDTLEIAGERIRLFGIDAPETRQRCRDEKGADYPCGRVAAFALADWIGRSVIICHPRDRDRYGRTVATCEARGDDMGAWLVLSGHALAFRRYSLDYVALEGMAKEARAGMWRGRFVPPWDWRHGTKHN